MPYRTPNLLMSLGFCQWYKPSNPNPSSFNVDSSGTKLIFKRLKQKATEQDQGKRVRVPGLPKFLAVVGSEASDTENPCFENVGGGEAAQKATSGAGKASLEEEEEEEDPDTHFKRKRKKLEPKETARKKSTQKKPHKKQVVKKAHRHTQKASTGAVTESVAEVPPPLIIRLPGQKETPRETAQVPISLIFFTSYSFIPFYFHA